MTVYVIDKVYPKNYNQQRHLIMKWQARYALNIVDVRT